MKTLLEQVKSLREAVRLDEAEALLLRALDAAPQSRALYLELASIYVACGDHTSAIASLEVARSEIGDDFELLFHLGTHYRTIGNHEAALDAFLQALRREPEHPGLIKGVGAALLDLQRPAEAIQFFRAAQQKLPNDVQTLNLLGSAAVGLELFELAETSFLRVTQLAPELADPYVNLGYIRELLGDTEGSIRYCTEALAVNPLHFRGRFNRASLYDQTLQSELARREYGILLSQVPHAQEVRHNLGLLALRCNRLREGWDNYQWRNMRYNFDRGYLGWTPQTPRLPVDLAGQTLQLLGEQGLGDELFFLRWLPLLRELGARTVFHPRNARLLPLLEQLDCIDQLAPPISTLQLQPANQYFIGDLPYLLLDRHGQAYPPSLRLSSDPQWTTRLRAQRFGGLPARPCIGLTWRAGMVMEGKVAERHKLLTKNVPLDRLLDLMAPLDVNVVILQRDPTPAELEHVEARLGRTVLQAWDLASDLQATLAVLDLLDDVVGVSNTNLHLRAALGKTALVLVPRPPEFRWLEHGNHSPWFPGFGVFRETYAQGWDEALQALAEVLQQRYAPRLPG